MASDSPNLIVLQSFPEPRPTTNPYIVMLHDSLAATPGIEVLTFTWRRALLGKYHLFHAHWPEILVSGASAPKKLARQALMVLFLLRLTLGRIPVVRTQHNLHRPSGISRREHLLLGWFERITRFSVVLNPDTPVPVGHGSAVIRHGHYRDWYAVHPAAEPIPGRVAFFGLVRQYKGLGHLIDVFRQVDDASLSLHIAGNPSSPELAADLEQRAAGDPRISLDLRFLPDADLVRAVTEGELVVLPYTEMHNSGGMLAALSLGRPVLAPENDVNTELGAEVGPEWIIGYRDELEPDDLVRALGSARAISAARPDLSEREWSDCGPRHAAAYRDAIAMGRR